MDDWITATVTDDAVNETEKFKRPLQYICSHMLLTNSSEVFFSQDVASDDLGKKVREKIQVLYF